MNMKLKILTAMMACMLGGAAMVDAGTAECGMAEAATAEHQTAQESVFVEVPLIEPALERTDPELASAPAEPEPAREETSEVPKPQEETNLSYREGLAAYITSVNESVPHADALTMADCALKQADAQDIDEKLILAVAHTESTYYSDAVSCADYKGLMQTGDVLAKEAGYRPEELFDPEVSIEVGAGYISDQLENFDDDVQLALTAYNQGPGSVYQGNYDTAYAELTLERVQNIENFLLEGGYLRH